MLCQIKTLLSLHSFQIPFSTFVSFPYSRVTKAAHLNAISFFKHPVRAHTEHDHKAQFETSIDSAVVLKSRLHAFFWSCPSKRDKVYLCFLPSSRLQFVGTVWSGTVFPIPFTFAFCHSCSCCCCSLPQFDSSCQKLHLWSSS